MNIFFNKIHLRSERSFSSVRLITPNFFFIKLFFFHIFTQSVRDFDYFYFSLFIFHTNFSLLLLFISWFPRSRLPSLLAITRTQLTVDRPSPVVNSLHFWLIESARIRQFERVGVRVRDSLREFPPAVVLVSLLLFFLSFFFLRGENWMGGKSKVSIPALHAFTSSSERGDLKL